MYTESRQRRLARKSGRIRGFGKDGDSPARRREVMQMTWVVALGLALVILYLMPLRIVRLHRRGQLTPRRFALTFATGWSLAILVVFYVGLVETLIARRDPLLTALGLIVASVNFALGYPIALVFHERVVKSLLKRLSRE